MTMFNRVHCHICPLKEVCSWSASESSWKFQQYYRYRIPRSDLRDADYEAVDKATMNCPLRKVFSKPTKCFTKPLEDDE